MADFWHPTGCRPCAHEPLVTRPAGGGPPTQGRDLRRAASGFPIGTSTVHRYVREAIKLLAAMAPTLAQSIEVARGQGPAARQDPTTPFNLMGHIFLNVHERNRDIS